MSADSPITLEEEFQKNRDLKKEEFETLREWCSKQRYLPSIPDKLLVLFYHSCYFNMTLTKTTIDNYFTTRTHVPEFFSNRDPYKSDVKHGKHVTGFFMLPGTTPDGYRVLFCRFVNKDPSAFVFNEASKSFTMVTDYDLYVNGTAPGYTILIDMGVVQLGHLARLGPLSMKKILYYLQDSMPVRLKGLHFINVVPFMDKILALMRPFLKKELMSMIVLHSNGMESLYPHIPKEMLPGDYGGKAPTFTQLHEAEVETLKQNSDWFLQESKLRVDESKRPGRAKNASDLYGIEGSFKKLELD